MINIESENELDVCVTGEEIMYQRIRHDVTARQELLDQHQCVSDLEEGEQHTDLQEPEEVVENEGM